MKDIEHQPHELVAADYNVFQIVANDEQTSRLLAVQQQLENGQLGLSSNRVERTRQRTWDVNNAWYNASFNPGMNGGSLFRSPHNKTSSSEQLLFKFDKDIDAMVVEWRSFSVEIDENILICNKVITDDQATTEQKFEALDWAHSFTNNRLEGLLPEFEQMPLRRIERIAKFAGRLLGRD